MRTYDGRAIANFVLDRCDAAQRDLTHVALQKIVYFCHAITLKALGRPLVREQFEAWQYGPVLPYVFQEFKDCGASPIRKRATRLDKETGRREIAKAELDSELESLLTDVVHAYGGLDAFALVQMSHAVDGPWYQVWNDKALRPGMKISNDTIKEHFSKRT